MRRTIVGLVSTALVVLTLTGCGSSSTAEKIAAAAKSDHHASAASCSQDAAVRLAGQQLVVYDCQLSGVGQIFRPPGARSASFRTCYVYNQGPVEVTPASLRRAAANTKFGCSS